MQRCLNSGETCYRLEHAKPDIRALTDALDRLFGKPTKVVDVTADVQTTNLVAIVHQYHPSACPACG